MKYQCDVLIRNCSILTPELGVAEEQAIAISDSRIIEIGPDLTLHMKYEAKDIISGKGKLAIPGLVDAHTHTCQQLLRGKITDEYPVIWVRFMIPFESNLAEDDVHLSAQLGCLEMIKSGTTTFADAGGVHMHKVAEAVIESGMRAAITRGTSDMGDLIPDSMKDSTTGAIAKTERLYKEYHGSGEGRVNIWFSFRSVLSCSAELIRQVAEKAREYGTGLHAHMNEYTNEVHYCLEKFQQRPVEFLDSLNVLGPNLLSAHSIALSDSEIALIKEKDVKVVHCPRSNFGKGVPKTPQMLNMGISIGFGSDGTAHAGLSLFNEIKAFRSAIFAYWGVPIYDPAVIPAKTLIKMATLGGARALLLDKEIGTLEVNKKADIVLLNIEQPHITPTHNLVNTLAEAVNGNDVQDVIINGKPVMLNRVLTTLDEERILYESKKRLKHLAVKTGI